MGNEQSTERASPGSPQTLEKLTADGVASYIKSGRVRRIVVMTGAGLSTSAGIPDFRSPDTGLYANLARLKLPYPEAVFDISFFRNNPLPFYNLAHELYPGKYRPTIAHSFIKLLHDKGLLHMLFTQNIDCLEREAGVPDDKIIEAHGSFANQRCIECKTEFPKDKMLEAVQTKEVPHCLTPQCNGLVKPDIVFFGEALPEAFIQRRGMAADADLAIIMGSSLSVYPFASLPSLCEDGTPRVLINRERVGDMGYRSDDVLLLGDCDDEIRKLADALEWRDELEELWRKTAPDEPPYEKEAPKDKDEVLNDEIEKLTADVDKSLKFSSEHVDRMQEELNAKDGESVTTNGVPSNEAATGENLHKTEGSDGLGHVFPHIDKKSTL